MLEVAAPSAQGLGIFGPKFPTVPLPAVRLSLGAIFIAEANGLFDGSLEFFQPGLQEKVEGYGGMKETSGQMNKIPLPHSGIRFIKKHLWLVLFPV